MVLEGEPLAEDLEPAIPGPSSFVVVPSSQLLIENLLTDRT
jgi:hypothetical protein